MSYLLRLSKPIVLFWVGAGIFALEQIDDYVETSWP